MGVINRNANKADSRSPLDRILDPISYETFASEYWGKASLWIQRGKPNYYSELLSEPALDNVLQAASRTRHAEVLDPEGRSYFARTQEQAIEAVRRGRSLRINAIQRFCPPINFLRVALERRFSCGINVNMYLTPENNRALGRHYDSHDVIALQISGEKRWLLFDQPVTDPLEYLPLLKGETPRDLKRYRLEKDRSASDQCNVVQELTLKNGDLLYVPRGHWHEAQGVAGTISCHLTIGMQVFTYADLLSVATGLASERIDLVRKALPLGFATEVDARAEVRDTVAQILKDLSPSIDSAKALGTVSRVFIRSRRAPTEGRLLTPGFGKDSRELRASSRVQVKQGLVLGIETGEMEVSLHFRAATQSFPLEFEGALRYIVINEHFTPAELPGEIALEEKIEFVDRLRSEGIVTVLRGRGAKGDSDPADMRGWLPVGLLKNERQIRWRYFGTTPLNEPFFKQSVRGLSTQRPPSPAKTTPINILREIVPDVQPSGFIFHVSRCGSTLLSNALKTIEGVRVVSEASVIGQVLSGISPDQLRSGADLLKMPGSQLLKGVINSFGRTHGRDEFSRLVLKFSSWNILYLRLIAELWPNVPRVVIIREPHEVAVSCLEHPPGWMGWKAKPAKTRRILGISEDSSVMTSEEYNARVIANFMKVVSENNDIPCTIYNYANLDVNAVLEIAHLFSIEPSPTDVSAVERSMSIYSKDPSGTVTFSSDSETKQAKVTAAIREAVSSHSLDTYHSLQPG